MCKKCTKQQHKLLRRDSDCLPRRKSDKDDGKEETHVVALSISEQVLQGPQLGSFIERLAQQLHLLHG